MIENKKLRMSVKKEGYVSALAIKDDPYQMNWVVEDTYLEQADYQDADKLFGHFDMTVDGKKACSNAVTPIIQEEKDKITVVFDFEGFQVTMDYDLGRDEESLFWTIQLKNLTEKELTVEEFGIWISFAYVMFRDKNVLRNIHNSAAVFPSVSIDYTKLDAVRRDGLGEDLGFYQIKGRAISIGTCCDYLNLFFENVSPSLDGILFHKLYLAGGYPKDFENHDWIYEKGGFALSAGENKTWEYVINPNRGPEDFQNQGLKWKHPKIEYTPLNMIGETARVSVKVPDGMDLSAADAFYKEGGIGKRLAIPIRKTAKKGQYSLSFKPEAMGEHKIVITLSDGTKDFIVLNVMDRIENVVDERVEYICDSLYHGENAEPPCAFEPVSNQGESLGKANLVLKKNLLGTLDVGQVRKVESCAVNYVRKKWFEDGDFRKPRKLYGDFYRCMDFEYIGHLFYLLSEFGDDVLALHSADTYLAWAADVFELRVNPDLHQEERGKEESQMLGVYFLYFHQLLDKLKAKGLTEKYEKIQSLWERIMNRLEKEAETYKAAITEHFYDNAGFGPTAGALCEGRRAESAKRYGELLLANIGCSNDFRAQNPDRWWEALTYMIHSLWGGVTAAASYKVFQYLKDTRYLEASYRATAGILYCYDTHATATTPLKKGMAASTYAVAAPHINRPDLSRARFGQSAFCRDGEIFSRLFENDSQPPDWDMGEEMVAYLENFGDKTFIMKKGASIHVINGSYEENETEYKITSFAPYSKEFYFISGNDIIQIEDKKDLRSITLKKERS